MRLPAIRYIAPPPPPPAPMAPAPMPPAAPGQPARIVDGVGGCVGAVMRHVIPKPLPKQARASSPGVGVSTPPSPCGSFASIIGASSPVGARFDEKPQPATVSATTAADRMLTAHSTPT